MNVKNQQQVNSTNQRMDNVTMNGGARDLFKAGLKEIHFRTAALLQAGGSCTGGKASAPRNADKGSDKESTVVLAA